MKDLINDEEEEIEEDSDNEGESGKRKHEDSDIDDQLEDEDYDLIEENLGVKVKRKVRLFCVRCISGEYTKKCKHVDLLIIFFPSEKFLTAKF